MGDKLGISHSTVSRIWKANGLKPHRIEAFKVSRDPEFVEKLEDIVGLYLSPPAHVLVLCCDEKSQIQALDCTQPGLPVKPGRAATMTHDYKRHGTTTLFAAMRTSCEVLLPVYEKTAAYFQFGRNEPKLTWEKTAKAAAPRAAVNR